jgi:DDE superfamily endonuclease
MSENGWTDDFLCKEWLRKSFIPQATARNTSGKPILLIYDGHGSHDTLDVITLSCEHNVILYCLPPHTTHKLQPLDVGVFGPFQRAWADRCDDIVEDTGKEMPREHFVKHYMEVRQKTFRKSTIISAFRKSGCWPVNPEVFTDVDYSPSIVTSTTSTHVPSSYPRMPTRHNSEEVSSHSDSESSDSGSSDKSSDRHDANPSTYLPAVIPPSMSTSTPSSSATFTFLPKPLPPRVFYGLTRSSLRSKSHPGRVPAPTIQAENAELQARVTTLESRVAMAEAHAALAHTEIQALKRQLNAKKDKSNQTTQAEC